MSKKDDFFLGVAKVENKEDGKKIGNRCPLFDHTGEKIVTLYA